MKTQLTARLLALMFTLAAIVPAAAAEWGSLKGRLVFDGDPGKPAAINVNKDGEYCGKHDLKDESITVGEKGGLTNAFVYLYVKKNGKVAIHPGLQKVGDKPAVLDNKGCRFEPRALLVRTSQPLEIRNSETDPSIGHNTNALTLFANPSFNNLIPQGQPFIVKFQKREARPAEFACNIHPWMKSYVLISDHPYMAVTGRDGSFEIKDLPAGRHEFNFWHEAVGNLKNLSVGGAKTSRKGRGKLKIPAGKTLDLGDVKVPAKLFGK